MHPLFSPAEIRAFETEGAARLPPGALMARAGAAAAAHILSLLPEETPRRVLVLAGPGNNGGDALACACALRAAGVLPAVALLGDPGRMPADAARAYAAARAAGLRWLAPDAIGADWDLAVDGLFGIGLARPLNGAAAALVAQVNALPCPVLALDVPSGLDAATGLVVGGGAAVRAAATLTFIGDKPGLHTGAGRDHAGRVLVDALGLAPAPGLLRLTEAADFAHCLRPRAHDSHKGTYGDVAVTGGADGMAGAVILAARAAAHCGAGRVHARFLGAAPAYDAPHPELMCRPAAEPAPARAVHVAGPGMSTGAKAHAALARLLAAPGPLVLDADALNLLAGDAGLRAACAARAAPTLLTPHPLEAARLLDTTVAAVQADRVAAARLLAARLHAVAVLKGSGSVVAAPDGRAAINPTGNPALATAGSGDVLSGACGALLAQGWPVWEAALGAVWVHGAAADRLVEQGAGPVGLTAGELPRALRACLNALAPRA